MDGLILAAGFGSRLRALEPCKPLTQLHGVSLLELSARQLAAVGVERVLVATGHEAERIEAALLAISRRVGVPVEARRVADHRQPNGFSVVDAARDIDGDFLLVMADHVFSREILEKLVHSRCDDAAAILAVDRRLESELIDPEDATWVATGPGGRIRQIGKTIPTYDAVDCGAFRATPALPEAICAAIRDGRPGSLSDGMQRLADAGRAGTVDIGSAWWIDVDDARALDLAKAQVAEHLPEIFARETGAAEPVAMAGPA